LHFIIFSIISSTAKAAPTLLKQGVSVVKQKIKGCGVLSQLTGMSEGNKLAVGGCLKQIVSTIVY